jgi:threonylcarbamoyladenosine tRNA methylthiotransferase MtaB
VKVFLEVYGCRANQYDTEAVRGMVLAAGHEIAAVPDDADVAVFNSCTVTSRAVADLRSGVRRAARANRGLRTVIMGCATARPEGRELANLPTVSHRIAGSDLGEVAGALGIDVHHASQAAGAQRGTRGLLRIQDGCDEHCTFCATTLARGAARSRPAVELLAEARLLGERHPEIVLTGIHIGSYGKDVGSTLGELLARLVDGVPDVRFRLGSVEATEIDDTIARIMRTSPERLAPHLHAPLQSGANELLKLMGRHWYTSESYADAVRNLTEECPAFGLGADIIAGFPGETDAHHRATIALIESLPFSYLHVFRYSPRPGTAATRLGREVPASVAAARASELRAAGKAAAARYHKARAGTGADVIVLGAQAGRREGLTGDYLTVALPDPAPPRGSRFGARLQVSGDTLVAVPHQV